MDIVTIRYKREKSLPYCDSFNISKIAVKCSVIVTRFAIPSSDIISDYHCIIYSMRVMTIFRFICFVAAV